MLRGTYLTAKRTLELTERSIWFKTTRQLEANILFDPGEYKDYTMVFGSSLKLEIWYFYSHFLDSSHYCLLPGLGLEFQTPIPVICCLYVLPDNCIGEFPAIPNCF